MRQKQFIAMFGQTVKEMLFWVNDEWQVAELLVALEAEDFFLFLWVYSCVVVVSLLMPQDQSFMLYSRNVLY